MNAFAKIHSNIVAKITIIDDYQC